MGRPPGNAVRWHRDRDPLRLSRAEIEDVDFATQLVDDAALVACAWPADIVFSARRELANSLGRRVELEEVECAGTVRREVNLISDPHRVASRTGPKCAAGSIAGTGQVEYEQILCPSPLIALPGAELAGKRRIEDPLTVGENVPPPETGIGRALGSPPSVGTVYSLVSDIVQPSRIERNRTDLPSGAQP